MSSPRNAQTIRNECRVCGNTNYTVMAHYGMPWCSRECRKVLEERERQLAEFVVTPTPEDIEKKRKETYVGEGEEPWNRKRKGTKKSTKGGHKDRRR